MKFDKRLIVIATAILYLLVIRLAVVPNWREASRIRKDTAKLNQELNSLSVLNVRYRAARSGLEAALAGGGSTGLLSVVQQKAEELGFSGRLKAVTPVVRQISPEFRIEGFDLRLEEMSLKDAVLFLESLQKEKGSYLDRLILEKSRDGMSLSVRFRLLTIRKL